MTVPTWPTSKTGWCGVSAGKPPVYAAKLSPAKPNHVHIAGAHYCKPAIRRVIENRGVTSTAQIDVWAELHPEPANRHDVHAVMVVIDGERVGYVPADQSPMYSYPLQKLWAQGFLVQVPVIIGARYRKDGTFGGFSAMEMSLPAPTELKLSWRTRRGIKAAHRAS